MTKMFKRLSKYYQIRKMFGEYITGEKVNHIFSKEFKKNDFRKLESGNIDYVIVYVAGDNPNLISQRMGEVAELAVFHGAIVNAMISSVVVNTFGTLKFKRQNKPDIEGFIESLKDKFSTNIKVVFGNRNAHYGNIGNNNRFEYSFIIDNFLDVLCKLREIDFGNIVEMK